MVSITAKDSSLLSNEHESWSISQLKRQQTVMETQQRMGRPRYLTWDRLSCSKHRSCASYRRKSQHATPLSAKSISYNSSECAGLCAGKKGKQIPLPLPVWSTVCTIPERHVLKSQKEVLKVQLWAKCQPTGHQHWQCIYKDIWPKCHLLSNPFYYWCALWHDSSLLSDIPPESCTW